MSSHLGLVLHVQVGNNSLYNYFNNPANQASSHFWASKTGLLEQYIDTDLSSWAQAAGNPYYLSVETEGYPNEPLTNAQLASVASLLQWSASVYNFPIVGPVAHGQPGFTPHCNPNGTPDPAWGNHPCPEAIRLGQMPTILTLAQPPPLPLPIQEDTMSLAVLPNGQVAISAVGAGSRNEHLLVFTLDPLNPAAPKYNVIDVTTGIGTANPYTVQSA